MNVHAIAMRQIDNDNDVPILITKINSQFGDQVVKINVETFDLPPDDVDQEYNDHFVNVELILSLDSDNDNDARLFFEQAFEVIECWMIVR